MKNKLLLAILFIANAPTIFLIGQARDGLSPYELSKQSFSPQVMGMKRYDRIGTPLSNGLVDLNIPLITYKDRDFEFPISLRYDSQGFKPADAGNYVGLSWLLSCGGIIHREIMGIPDDLHRLYNQQHYEEVKGFLHIYDKSLNPSFTSVADKNEILGAPGNYLKIAEWNNIAVIKNTDNIEASSDIYHFSFGNHSGKFIIGYDGSVNVVSYKGGKYKVDISNFHFSFSVHEGSITTWKDAPEIRIIADDGYIYTFGGTYASLEYMALSWVWQKNIHPNYDRIHRITAFHLTRITAPNGRSMIISYLDPIEDKTFHEFPDKLINTNIETLKRKKYHQTYILNVTPFQHFSENFIGHSNDDPLHTSFITYRKHVLNKVSLISSISTDAGAIHFYYSDREKSLFDPEKDTSFGAACGARLDSLVFTSNGHIKTTSMNYEYSYGRMLLKSIHDSQLGRYNLGYNYCPPVDPFTIDIDHWDYWTGGSSNKTLLPDLDYSQLRFWIEGPYANYRGSNREPTGNNFDAYLLREIQYPTGGYTKYTYEPHDYERYLDQKGSDYDLSLSGAISGNQKGKLAGGARLRQISYCTDYSSPVKTVFYQYTEGKHLSRSSGILLKRKPVYVYGIHSDDTRPHDSPIISYKSNGHQPPADYTSSYIKYSRVFESQSEANKSGISIMITHLDKVRKRSGEIPFGNSADLESQDCILKFIGTGNPQRPGIMTLRIRGSKKSESRDYQFTSGSLDYIENSKIILKPVEEFGEGVIEFYVDCPEGEYFSLDMSTSGMTVSTNGYKEYLFTNFAGNKDSEYRTFIPSDVRIISSVSLPFISYYGKKVLDHSQERGLLYKVNSYNANGDLVQTIEHKYERQNYDNYGVSVFAHSIPQEPNYEDLFDNNTAVVAQFGTIHQVFKIPLYSYLQTENIVTNYITDGGIATPYINQESYKYDMNGYLKTKEIKLLSSTSSASSSVKYKYAFEESGESYETMKKLNILSSITQSSTYNGENNPQLISVLKKNYDLIENLYRKPGAAKKELPIIKSVEYGKNEALLEKRVEHLKFDLYGNPIYLIKDSLTHIVYLWGYQGRYPIAQIEGVTYDEVLNSLDNTPPENFSLEFEPDPILFEKLREKLPQAHIYTFTYNPLVGIVNETDDRGITTYYDYDKRNRLKEVYIIGLSGQKEILKHYQYSFK